MRYASFFFFSLPSYGSLADSTPLDKSVGFYVEVYAVDVVPLINS